MSNAPKQEHGVDAQDAGAHREQEADEEFDEDFRVTGVEETHAIGQLLHAGKLLDLGHHVAERTAVEFGGERDVALALVARDLGRAAGEFDACHRRQRHRTITPGHAQLSDQLRRGQILLGETDADRHLPLGQVEFGQALHEIARGRDARGLGDGVGGDTAFRRTRRVRRDDHFRPQQ